MKKFLITAAALGVLSTTAFAANFNFPSDPTASNSSSKSYIVPAPDYTVNPAGATDYVTRPANLNNANEPQHSLKDYIVEGNN